MKAPAWLILLLLAGAAVAAYIYWPKLRKSTTPAPAPSPSPETSVVTGNYDNPDRNVWQPWMHGGGVLQG